MSFMFEKLDVYPKTVDFADQAASLTEQFPRGMATSQINSTVPLFQSQQTSQKATADSQFPTANTSLLLLAALYKNVFHY